MSNLKNEDFDDLLQLGDFVLSSIRTFHGLEDLPAELDTNTLMVLQLPSIPIQAAGINSGCREFFLCFSPPLSFLFVVETKLTKYNRNVYRPQYGANDNYDLVTEESRVVWLYSVNSARVSDPTIARHLKPYLPPSRFQ